MNEGVSSLARPAPVASQDRSDSADSSVNEDDKARRRFTRSAQKGEVNRVLERMNSQSVLLSGTASSSMSSNANGRRSKLLSLTDHGTFQSSRLLSQSEHVGSSWATKPLLDRLDSEASFASEESFEEATEEAGEERDKEKPASFRQRPRLRSDTNSIAANRVLGRMESKRTLGDLIEESQTRSRPTRTSSGMSTSTSSQTDESVERKSRPMRSRSIDEIDEQIHLLEPKQSKDSSEQEEAPPKDAARRVLGRMESKRTLTDLIQDTSARSSRPPRTRPTFAEIGIPERSRPSRTRSDTKSASEMPSSARPTRASSITGTPEQLPHSGPLSTSRRNRSSSMDDTPLLSSKKEQVEQEAYALEKAAERKRLEAMELLRQAEEAEAEADRKLAKAAAAAAEESESTPAAAPEPISTPVLKSLDSGTLSRSSVISAITVEEEDDDSDDSDGDNRKTENDEEDDDESSGSSEDSSSDNDSKAASEAHSDSSSDVYLDESERSEEVVPMPAEDVERKKLVPKTQQLQQTEKLGQSDGFGGLVDPNDANDNSGDEEEIQRRAEERRRLRESGHLDIMTPVRVGVLNIKSGYAGMGSSSSGIGSAGRLTEDETSNEASNDDDSARRRARDRRIRELEERATTSSSSFDSEVLGVDIGDESGSQVDADKARRKAERLERRSKRASASAEQQQSIQSPGEKAQRKAQREKEIEKRKAELEARRAEAQKRKEERRKLLGVRDVDQ